MASFTDLIPQFNPYIQQLPVDAMVQVGMEKQKRYDEGLQKIQSQIEQVAGIDISKPAHKAYLQSKLNELGNNLKGVAAGDFSNFQLVNSVGGMIGQVVKDPVILNAYQSTQHIKKQQEYMEKAKREGKSSPENETWFNNQLAEWYNDPDILTKFTGEYYEYVDVDKKLRDVADKIKEMEQSIDIPYQRNPDGSYRLDRNGNPLIDDAMLRVKVKGTPAEKILNNFFSSLNENDKRQLMITGNYHYRNATPETFKKDIVATYDASKKALSDQVVQWSVDLRNNQKLTAAQRAELEAKIKDANDKINNGSFEKEAAKKMDEIDKADMKDFKYRLYTQKYLTGLAQDLSNQSYTQEIMSNPYAQMAMEKKKFAFDVERARVQDAQFWANFGLNQAKFDWEKQTWMAENAPYQTKVGYGGLGTGVQPPTLFDVDRARETTQSDIDKLDLKYGPLLFPKLTGNSRKEALDKLVTDYVANPSSITDNDQRKYVEEIMEKQNVLARQNGLYNSTLNNPAIQQFNTDVKNLLKDAPGIRFKDGSQLYSGEDLYTVRSKMLDFMTVSVTGSTGGAGASTSFNSQAFINSVPNRLKPIAVALAKSQTNQNLTTTEKKIVSTANLLNNEYRGKVENIYRNRLKAESDFLAARMPEFQTTFGRLNMENKNTKLSTEDLIANATRSYDEFGALDVKNPQDFNPTTVSSWRTGKEAADLKYVVEKKYDGSGQLVIFKGTEKQIIPLNASDLNKYYPDVAQRSFMTDVKSQIISSPGFTTNTIGRKNPVGASISGYKIPSLASSGYGAITRLDIEGDVDNNGGESDVFQVRMYVYDNGVWKDAILNNQGYVSAAGVEEIINAIGPRTVEDVLRKK